MTTWIKLVASNWVRETNPYMTPITSEFAERDWLAIRTSPTAFTVLLDTPTLRIAVSNGRIWAYAQKKDE